MARREVAFGLVSVAVTLLFVFDSKPASATPQFARETNMPCFSCHTHVPRLNEFGQKFLANGYRLPNGHKPLTTYPWWFELVASQTRDAEADETSRVMFDDSSVSSFGYFDRERILYHFTWSPLARELEVNALQRIGSSAAIQVGKIMPLSQYDPGMDWFLSTPIYLEPEDNGSTPEGSFGPFAASGDIFGVRAVLAKGSPMPYGNGWVAAVTVPFSNEGGDGVLFDTGHKARGAFFEAYRRQGMNSLGVNMYTGVDGRHYYGTIGQYRLGKFYLQGGGSYSTWDGGKTHAYSLGIDWTRSFHDAYGLRMDVQDGVVSYIPTASFILGAPNSALQLVVEENIRAGVKPLTTAALVYRF